MRIKRVPCYATVAVALGIASPCWAQVISEFPNPHASTCADFHHHKANGTWSPKGEVQVTTGAGTASLGPSSVIAAGKPIEGTDLGKWLDDNCRKSKFW